MTEQYREITPDNIHTFEDKEILQRVGCFGTQWNPYDRGCNPACIAQHRCFHRLAIHTLPQEALERSAYDADHEKGTLIPQLGRLDVHELAQDLATDHRALLYAVSYSKDQSKGLPIIQPDGSLIPSGKGPPIPFDAAPAPIPEPKKEATPPTPAITDEALDALAEEEPAPKPVQKKEKASPKQKKTTAKKAPAAKKASPKKAPLKEKKAAKSEPVIEYVHPESFVRRFETDRAKYPMAEGTVITKKIGNTTHTLRFTADGYAYGGKLYPTLLAVSQAQGNLMEVNKKDQGTITTAKMSAKRWFNLK